MDPISAIGLAASALTLLDTAFKVSDVVDKLISARRVPEAAGRLLNEISAFCSALRAVALALRSVRLSEDTAVQATLCEINKIFQHAERVFDMLGAFIKDKLLGGKDIPEDFGDAPEVSRWAWVRHEKTVMQYQQHINILRQDLLLSMVSLNTVVVGNIHMSVSSQPALTIQDVTFDTLQTIFSNHAQKMQSLDMKVEQILSNVKAQPTSHYQSLIGAPRTLADLKAAEESHLEHAQVSKPKPSSSSKPEHPDSNSGLLRITTTLGSEQCDRYCRCQCHQRTQLQTPRWARAVLGSFFYLATGSPLLNRRACDYRPCKRSGTPSTRFIYYAPSWALAKIYSFTAIGHSLLGTGANLHIRVPRYVSRSTPIWTLISMGKLDRIRFLFEKKLATPFDVDADGESYLYYAAAEVQPEVCQLLIELGADPYLCDHEGRAPFELGLDHVFSNPPACRNLSETTVKKFDEVFKDEESYDNLGLTTIHRIVLGIISVDLATYMDLSANPRNEVNSRDAVGRTPLLWAARRGDCKAIKVLLRWGADINLADHTGTTPLHKASADGNDESVELLLRANASVSPVAKAGGAALHNVSFSPHNRVRTIRALIAHGANVGQHSSTNEFTPLHWFSNARTPGAFDNIRALLEGGADINAADSFGDPVVFDAVLLSRVPLLKLLIAEGARLDMRRKSGGTILHIAALHADMDTMEVLTMAGKKGLLSNVDLDAKNRHHHTCLECFESCRDDWYVGERETMAIEREGFRRLVATIRPEEQGDRAHGASESIHLGIAQAESRDLEGDPVLIVSVDTTNEVTENIASLTLVDDLRSSSNFEELIPA